VRQCPGEFARGVVCVVARLYSFFRAKGINAVLIAGTPMRSIAQNRRSRTGRACPSGGCCAAQSVALTPMTLPAGPFSIVAGTLNAII